MDSEKKKLIRLLVENRESQKNKIFGKLIIQTNEVQFYLSSLVLLQSSFLDKKYRDHVENATFGNIINLFCACSKEGPSIKLLIEDLRKYVEQRNRLAHKMFTKKKLTEEECKAAIITGKEILKALSNLLKEELSA